jgi:hypothetical protein
MSFSFRKDVNNGKDVDLVGAVIVMEYKWLRGIRRLIQSSNMRLLSIKCTYHFFDNAWRRS